MTTPERIQDALSQVNDFPSFCERLLRGALGWPLPPGIDEREEITYGWSQEDLRASDLDAHLLEGQVHQIRPLPGAAQPWGIFILEFAREEVFTRRRGMASVLRAVLRGLVPSKRKQSNLPEWDQEDLLFICTHDWRHYSIVHFSKPARQGHAARLSSFGWLQGGKKFRTLIEHNLPHLAWPDDPAKHDAWRKEWRKAFDKEPLTKEFFKRFQKALELIETDLREKQSLKSAEAYSHAQLLLERLLFLYFLQNRGWLNQARSYLLDEFNANHRAKPEAFSFYQDFLERVFYALATPPDAKGPDGEPRLPGLPFLNGGLFDDDEFAPTPTRKKSNPPLKIRNATFAEVFESLLEAFNFTVAEDTPLSQDVSVDPEMLGKVFESIVLHAEAADPDAVAPDKRKATGSYYTPRIVVHFICRETLCLWLLSHLPADADWSRRLRGLMGIEVADLMDRDDLDAIRSFITPEEGGKLFGLVENLKCCDPAVGSGAFPVGLLHELVSFRRIAEAAANGYVDPVRKSGADWIHKTKAQIIEKCLYGADIQQQAIEICRLRLWLSLVVDYDIGCDPFDADRQQFQKAIRAISQLPNLEMNFRRGDSLLDMVSGVPIRLDAGIVSAHRELVERIQKLAHELHRARKGERKRELRVKIMDRRLELSRVVLERESRALQDEESNLAQDFAGLTGSARERQKQIAHERAQIKKALGKLESERQLLDKLAASLDAPDFYPRLRRLEGAEAGSAFNFVWSVDFAEILAARSPASGSSAERGGFDLIVGNPPFVTARNPERREQYRERWARVCHGKYLLICPFFDLSFGLLRPDGELGFIVSNAFAKREFGQPLIENFFPTVDVQKVVDCSGLMFPGHGTPTCIVFGAHRTPNETQPIRVAALLPGGGDLRTPPEESPVWQTLAVQHDNSHYSGQQVTVSDRSRKEMSEWPWNFDADAGTTKTSIEARSVAPLREFLAEDIGFDVIFGARELFDNPWALWRRYAVPMPYLIPFSEGEMLRNYVVDETAICFFPYGKNLKPKLSSKLAPHFEPWRKLLSERPQLGGLSQVEAGFEWFEFYRFTKRGQTPALSFPEIATHAHFVYFDGPRVFTQKAPLVKLKSARSQDFHLVAGWLNSAPVLLWLKQVCFNKGAGEDEHRDRFEYGGGKVQQLPTPLTIAEALNGKVNPQAEKLAALAFACWRNGRGFQSVALRKLFEQQGEAYHLWISELPGWTAPAPECDPPFGSTEDLRARLVAVVGRRERLRAEMIALQEEMDWLVYAAYGLLAMDSPALPPLAEESLPPPLNEAERPFRLWANAEGDFGRAVALIPSGWSKDRRALWEARLAAIRDNEHIRRIEAPVYKRRWDEQWKVSNRWMAGPVAYAQELVDAFRHWLAEKAEWHLEHKAKGGPLALVAWTSALWEDDRIQAAWPVAVDALNQVEAWKAEDGEKKPKRADADATAFARFFKETVNDETVPDGIPPAVPWEQVEKDWAKEKKKLPTKAKQIRGKLNVPRERFRLDSEGRYLWAGKATQSEGKAKAAKE